MEAAADSEIPDDQIEEFGDDLEEEGIPLVEYGGDEEADENPPEPVAEVHLIFPIFCIA
jgi:hypothetical protein